MVIGLALLAAAGCQEKRRPSTDIAPVGVPAGGTGSGGAGAGQAGGGGGAEHPSRMGGGGGMPTDDVHGGGGGGGEGGDETVPNPHESMGGDGEMDPARVITGTIERSPALAAQINAGEVIYVTVKPVDDKGVVPAGARALGVAQLHAGEWPLAFQVSGPAGAQVAVIARVDRDGDGMTRVAGDVEGTARTPVPGTAVKVVLDTVVP